MTKTKTVMAVETGDSCDSDEVTSNSPLTGPAEPLTRTTECGASAGAGLRGQQGAGTNVVGVKRDRVVRKTGRGRLCAVRSERSPRCRGAQLPSDGPNLTGSGPVCFTACRRFTPGYTARMGHWSESLADEVTLEVARRGGVMPDRQRVLELLGQVGQEIDVLAGRSFRPAYRATSVLEPNGMPFVDFPDLRVGSLDSAGTGWEIPDPVNPEIATVAQLAPLIDPVPSAVPIAQASGTRVSY